MTNQQFLRKLYDVAKREARQELQREQAQKQNLQANNGKHEILRMIETAAKQVGDNIRKEQAQKEAYLKIRHSKEWPEIEKEINKALEPIKQGIELLEKEREKLKNTLELKRFNKRMYDKAMTDRGYFNPSSNHLTF